MATLTFSGTGATAYTVTAPYTGTGALYYTADGTGITTQSTWSGCKMLSTAAIASPHEVVVAIRRDAVESSHEVGACFLNAAGTVGASLLLVGTSLILRNASNDATIASATVSQPTGANTLKLKILSLTTGELYCEYNGTEYLSGSVFSESKTDLHYGISEWRTSDTALAVTALTDNSLSSSTLDSLSSPVNVGGTGYTGTTTGLGTASSLTFAGKAATITGTGSGTLAFSMPTFVHGVTYPAMGVQTFTVGDGTLTATKTATVNSLSGYTPVTMATLDRGEWSIGKDTNIVTGDVVHLPTASGTLNTDGTLTDYVFGAYTMWRRDVSDGKMYSSTLTVSESGVGGGGSLWLTSIKITSSGLTSSGLTTI